MSLEMIAHVGDCAIIHIDICRHNILPGPSATCINHQIIQDRCSDTSMQDMIIADVVLLHGPCAGRASFLCIRLDLDMGSDGILLSGDKIIFIFQDRQIFSFPSRILQSQIFFWIWNQPGDVTWLIHNYETDIRSNSYQHKRHQKVSFSLPQFSWNSAASISFGPPSGTIGRKPI